jgi:hypothetical protein
MTERYRASARSCPVVGSYGVCWLVNDVGSPCARQAAGPVAGVSEPQLDGLGR